MPFADPWTDAPSSQLERNALRFYWQSRAATSPESWSLLFAVLLGDEVVGSTSIGADGFPVVRTFEKLMGTDKVDLILPPWGTGANFAVMPLIQKYGYPMLAPTATSSDLALVDVACMSTR